MKSIAKHDIAPVLKRIGAIATLLAAGGMARAQEQTPPAEKAHARRVFAHYMVCFGGTTERYKEEIALAQRHGIEGFALNCGEWLRVNRESGETTPTNYVPMAERMYQAAKELGTGFQLFFSADVATLRNIEVNIPDMIGRFYDHPNQFRLGERRVLSTWAGSPAGYRDLIEGMKADGREICFVPMVYPPKYKMTWSHETVRDFFDGHPHMDGVFFFGIDGAINDIIRCNAMGRRVTQHLGKLFMAGVGPAYNSANLRDFQGFRGYGAIWEGIIRDGADWVELFTWNDYNEDSNLMPWRWQRNWSKPYFDRDESFLDVTGFYARWFRSGQRPEIVQDKIYYAYRNRSHWLRREWDPKTEAWVDISLTPRWFDQIHDDVQDKLYATTFLTAPAELLIDLAGTTHRFTQAAGVGHVEVPLAGGVPRFTLRRAERELTAFSGRKQIIDEATQTQRNSWRGMHLANRLWTGGAAVGPVIARYEAAAGELLGDATVETRGGVRGVLNRETDGSGFRMAVSDLETATYSVRVTYSNPTDLEARLTLYADGPPRGAGDYPYYIPLFMPPTAAGEFATVSFLWSLYDTTTHVMPVWKANSDAYEQYRDHPLTPDQGSALITTIELIKVEPAAEPGLRRVLFPELVAIPGGTFAMGADGTVPDEGPAHQVTVSSFAIGKYPVTNEQFERFEPSHRQHRDGFSWRDREPVIYVNWFDAVNYCNWLSAQAELSPAYAVDGRNVTFHPEAEGFRLPSEAEWEYVASGRSEGRRYPWGNDEPVPGRHGNFPGQDVLDPATNILSDPGGGTVAVGGYPAGASRDGVLDLAGNVCEWVNDWFEAYTAEAKVDPHVQETTHGNYRSIRGSSFGYYGKPLRVTDREFNNPVYGGYIYIGFRVALSEAGLRKLMDSLNLR